MTAELVDLPITNAKQVAMVFADVMPTPGTRAACVLAFYDDLPADYQAAVLETICKRLNTQGVTT